MPNGGSDCCGTCWFNKANRSARERSDREGFLHWKMVRQSSGEAYCEIRNEPIEDPFWTYCANHPKKRFGIDRIPIGPMLEAEHTGGFAYRRVISKPSPDTEEIRQHLLDLLSKIETDTFADAYPSSPSVAQFVVWQLGEFREQRAEAALQRIVNNPPESYKEFTEEASRGGAWDYRKATWEVLGTIERLHWKQ